MPLGKLRDRAQRLEGRRWCEFCEHGTIRRSVLGMIRRDCHVHPAAQTDAGHGHFEGSHADAWRLDGEIVLTDRQEIQPNATLGVDRIRRRNSVERTTQTAHGITEKKIHTSRVLEGIAEVGAFDTISRDGAAKCRLMALLVLFTEELLELDRRAADIRRTGPLGTLGVVGWAASVTAQQCHKTQISRRHFASHYIPSMIAFSVTLGRIAAAHLASSGK